MKDELPLFVAAAEKRFFAAESLDVTVDEGMPVKVVASVVKIGPMGMVAKSHIKLSSPADLEGRTVEISPVSTLSQIWEAYAQTNNIDVSEVNVVRAASSARFNLLLSDKVEILGDLS